jgi:hypothetical protein
MKLYDIIYDKDCYVYSTSYRFCFSPFAFAPSTTVGPMDGDFSRAVNITWNRKDRNLLPVLHQEVCEAARKWGLDRLHQLAVLAFTYPKGRARDGLEVLADSDDFPFLMTTMTFMQSFVPTKLPSSNQLEEARAVWSGGLTRATTDITSQKSKIQEIIKQGPERIGPTIDACCEDPNQRPFAQALLDNALEDYFLLQLAMFANTKVNAYVTINRWKNAGLKLPAEGTPEFFPYEKASAARGSEMSEIRQEEPNHLVRIDPNHLKRISERTHKVHCELSDWLTSSSAHSKTQIEIWDNLLAHVLKMQPELDAIRSDIQTMSDPTGKFIENEFIVKYGELVSLSQMRAQIQTALNECLKPRGNDWINYTCSQVDVMEQAFKSIFATLEEIVDRNKL